MSAHARDHLASKDVQEYLSFILSNMPSILPQ